jgi:hypothetical protein
MLVYSRLLAMKRNLAVRGVVMTHHPGLSLKPDDLLFVAMLTAWVLIVALVAYLLLGWVGAAGVISAASLFSAGMIAAQSRQHRRHGHQGKPVGSHGRAIGNAI